MEERPSEVIFEVQEAPEGGFTARGIGFGIHVQAEGLEALKAAARDAVLCHFEEGQAPRMIRLHLVRDLLVAV